MTQPTALWVLVLELRRPFPTNSVMDPLGPSALNRTPAWELGEMAQGLGLRSLPFLDDMQSRGSVACAYSGH